ncbi:competence type IV pilus minor pilin ComGD [Oceanobacillus sp. FSL H7-0719]|uniref:competence type IV pilus minor pilin ComGD n=1 Tax=Oceanobacillus sp. FSL H7-0719 TaxID=2954507 RepID=UPI0032512362
MRKNAFTLIEMLLVLSVLSILILFAAPFHASTITKQEEKQFIELFQFDVLLIQNQASIQSKRKMYIRFFDDHYLILHGTNVPYAKRSYPRGWSIVGINRILEFHNSGTFLSPRTITMYSEDERIAFIFPLGKGRFYIEREKRIFNN